jgi:hypothetical protein
MTQEPNWPDSASMPWPSSAASTADNPNLPAATLAM